MGEFQKKLKKAYKDAPEKASQETGGDESEDEEWSFMSKLKGLKQKLMGKKKSKHAH